MTYQHLEIALKNLQIKYTPILDPMTSPFINCPVTNQETTAYPRKMCSLVSHRVANMKGFFKSANLWRMVFQFYAKQENEVTLQHPCLTRKAFSTILLSGFALYLIYSSPWRQPRGFKESINSSSCSISVSQDHRRQFSLY